MGWRFLLFSVLATQGHAKKPAADLRVQQHKFWWWSSLLIICNYILGIRNFSDCILVLGRLWYTISGCMLQFLLNSNSEMDFLLPRKFLRVQVYLKCKWKYKDKRKKKRWFVLSRNDEVSFLAQGELNNILPPNLPSQGHQTATQTVTRQSRGRGKSLVAQKSWGPVRAQSTLQFCYKFIRTNKPSVLLHR